MSKDPTADAVGRLVAARPLAELAGLIQQNRAVTASGLWGSSIAAVTAAIESQLHRPILVVCGHLDEADDLADDMELFHGRRPDVLPALETGGSLGRLSEEQVANRLRLIADGCCVNRLISPQLLFTGTKKRQEENQHKSY
jgi:hypothetical protein